MAKNSGGDVISHCNLVRTRINGSGELVTVVTNLGTASSVLLNNSTLSDGSGKSISQLANFRAEKISVEIRVRNIDEWFKVSGMYAYVKQTAASYPLV